MKRIYNTNTEKTLWRGEDYFVDGVLASVDPPLYLLTEVVRDKPEFNSSTHKLRKVASFADLNTAEWVVLSWEAVELSEFERRQLVRQTARQNLRAAWDSLPYDYIRGPYRDKFAAANSLLDEGDDQAAIALIQYTQPSSEFSEEQLAIFNAVKSQMMSGIQNLNQ